jgi:hypothetical protein
VHRGGGFTPVDAATQLSQGQKTWMGFIASVMEPAPATRAAVEATTNKDALGRPIASGTPKQAAVQAGEWAAGYVPPAQMALDAVRGKGLQALGRQAMLDVPGKDADAKKMRGKKMRGKKFQDNMNRARARKDPILQALGGPGENSN